MEAAIEQERDREPIIGERMASLQAYYARLEGGSENGPGRFQELVAAEPEPGRERLR
jgi:hypothetical protein